MVKLRSTSEKYLFKSKRLGFRKFKAVDEEPFFKMNSDPDVMKYFPSTLSLSESNSLIEKINHHIDEYGFGFFAVDLLSENKFIGFIGLKRTDFKASFTPCVEIGWRLSNEYWNQGLATEGALRSLEYAFQELEINTIYSFTSLLNIPSERIMQKVGMHKIEEFHHPLLESTHLLSLHCLYRLTKNGFFKE